MKGSAAKTEDHSINWIYHACSVHVAVAYTGHSLEDKIQRSLISTFSRSSNGRRRSQRRMLADANTAERLGRFMTLWSVRFALLGDHIRGDRSRRHLQEKFELVSGMRVAPASAMAEMSARQFRQAIID